MNASDKPVVAIVETLLAQIEKLESSRRMTEDVLREVTATTYVLQDAIPILQMMDTDVPAVADAILHIQDDLDKLQGACRLFLQVSRVRALEDAAQALSNHKLILNAELNGLAKCSTRASDATSKAKKKFEVAPSQTVADMEPAIDKALRVLSQHDDSLQLAAFADGPSKLTVDLLKALADHWGILLPKKLKKKQPIVDYLHKARTRPAKKPLGDISNEQVITVAW